MPLLDAARIRLGWSLALASIVASACTTGTAENSTLASAGDEMSSSSGDSTTSTSTDDGSTDDTEESGDSSDSDATSGGTTDAANAFCGDSVVEGFEHCDCGPDFECTPEELNGLGCQDVLHEESGSNFDGGVLWCNLACRFDVSGCFVCGDGVKEEFEPCDGSEFGDNSCGSQGFLGGEIACTNSCELDTSACTVANWSDDFESGDFSSGNYGFVGNGWSVAQGESVSGYNAASSNPIVANEATEMNLAVNFEVAGTIAFMHKEASEGCCDHLTFYIDGAQQMQWGGVNLWAEASFPVPAGTHSLRWVYDKDGSVDTAPDKAWVDDIRTDGTPQ